MSKDGLNRRDFLKATSGAAGASLVPHSAPAAVVASPGPQTSTSINRWQTALSLPIQTEDVVEFQLRHYLMKRVPPLPTPRTAQEWTAQEAQLRKHILEHVIYHGWPKEWVNAAPKFEDAGTIECKGFRVRKLRYEVVPDFWTTALLYEPENLSGKVPATMNVSGHAVTDGKAAGYKQKRCINNALRGMLALNLEWIGMGEMARPENDHWVGAQLNLVGASATGLHYLALRKALDYLVQHPHVDTSRIGVTGLSGGAWQTIMISALDERVAVAIPIAGYFAFASAIERNSDVGDMEYHPPDLFVGCDYTTLTAMRAPRPTLLMYGVVDQYGLRAPLQKPNLYDDIKPFFQLYGKGDDLAWHTNYDPGTHNYELDNRQQAYAFFTKHFNMPVVEREIPVDDQVKSMAELNVGIPQNNLTILSLAQKMGTAISRPPVPTVPNARAAWAAAARLKLSKIVRYNPVTMKHVWPVSSTWHDGVDTLSYRFEFNNELSAVGIWLKEAATPENAPAVIIMDDAGRPADLDALSSFLRQGKQVLVLNVIFTGDASPNVPKDRWKIPEIYTELYTTERDLPNVKGWLLSRPPAALYGLLLAASGEQPLGLQSAQLITVAKWLRETTKCPEIVLDSNGIRSQVTALVAAGLEPKTFQEVHIAEGMPSFSYLSAKFVKYQQAPDLFCLDLYKEFDIDSLAQLSEPTKVNQTFLETS